NQFCVALHTDTPDLQCKGVDCVEGTETIAQKRLPNWNRSRILLPKIEPCPRDRVWGHSAFMIDAADVQRRSLVLLGLFWFGSIPFSAAYCQAPLYYSNQNQYFLYGLARAGEGYLRDDWLAQTGDPTPLFSGLVSFTARFLQPWVFHIYHALLQGVYLAAL